MSADEPASADASVWIKSLRRSHERVAAAVGGLDGAGLERPSYCSGWDIAQVLSHLGSQAEIFSLIFDAGLSGGDAPPQDAFPAIWDAWNERGPQEQVADSLAANDTLVGRLEGLDASQLDSFGVAAFGMQIDARLFTRLRLGEHALHTWDVVVTLDPSATVAPDAVALLIDGVPDLVARVGKPTAGPATLRVSTTGPERSFALVTNGVRLEPWTERDVDGVLRISAEELLRLAYGRLDSSHTTTAHLDAPGITLDDLWAVFPGV